MNKPGKKPVLGRGLSALLGAEAAEGHDAPDATSAPAPGPAGVATVPVAAVEPNPFQPRTYFDPLALGELADSIRQQGIIQPITVRRLAEGQYQLISGERRLQASKLAGLADIPAYVRTANDEQMMEMALIENVQREDLNPIEVSLAYKRLMDEIGLTLEQVGEKVGKNRATVNNYLRLLKLPPQLQAGLRDGQLSMGHARALISLENPVQQIGIFKEIMDQALSVRQVEDRVRALTDAEKGKAARPKGAAPEKEDIHLREVRRTLEHRFGTKVAITAGAEGKGEIRLAYYSADDLNRIIELLQ